MRLQGEQMKDESKTLEGKKNVAHVSLFESND